MPKRPCLNCGVLHTNTTRCDTCQATWDQTHEQTRGSATARGYGSAYQKTARLVLAEHHRGWPGMCPGWQRPPHPSEDLTVDHIIPKARGGTDDRENLQVLCRPCNSTKAAADPTMPAPRRRW
jgi:5-methylcytosine-specific restriction enzyme A